MVLQIAEEHKEHKIALIDESKQTNFLDCCRLFNKMCKTFPIPYQILRQKFEYLITMNGAYFIKFANFIEFISSILRTRAKSIEQKANIGNSL